MDAKPLFIFSRTRSGSTLLQRVLGSYDEVATVTEPYLLLPYVYALRERGAVAEYVHAFAVQGIEDFCKELPGGVDDYWAEVRALALALYGRAAGGQEGERPIRYFLDKTPPYFLIIEEIMRLFPDGKFVFLWRNPLSQLASMLQLQHGRWNPAHFRVILFDGIECLTRAYRRHRDDVCAVRYEDLVGGDVAPWNRITDYLELEFDPGSLSRFSSVQLHGRGGDPTGVNLYSSLSRDPLGKWRETINNPLRKAWCRRYLRWIGRERLTLMGYDLDELLDEVDRVPSTADRIGDDLLQVADALVKEPLRARARRSVGLGGASGLRPLFEAPRDAA
jgi:Sulfotransferase family